MAFSATHPHTAAPSAGALAAPGRWERIGAALCLAQFSEPLFAAIAQSQGLTEPPGYARLFFFPVYAFLAWVIWRERGAAFRTAAAAPLLMGLLLLTFVSTLWSIDSGATLRRSVWLGLTMAFGLYLAWRYTWRQMLEVVAGGYIVLIAGSFFTALIAPSVGIMTQEHVGAWSGLWTHKNTLGGIMALGVGITAGAALVSRERRMLWIAVLLGAFALVVLSTSKTALLASLVGLTVIAAGMLVRRGPLQTIVVTSLATAAVIVVASVALLTPDLLVSAIGRDLTLTGRTDIWAATGPAVAGAPWLGYGYYAFWLPEFGPAYYVREAVQWQVQSAHSGWLETALGLGRAGVVLFALQLAATLWRGLGAVMRVDAGLWSLSFLLTFAIYTLSESHVLQANDIFWAIYVAVAARLALESKHA